MTKAIFVGGTASHVGKSWMATAICRYLYRRGLRVAPFKAQNMSNNSYPCKGGREIGRAQVAQAEACGLEPEPDMNPVLLKPTSNKGSQVVVNGRVWKNLSAADYYRHNRTLRDAAIAAYRRLARRFDFIVMEGAGSIAELNLMSRDFVNLRMARAASARALLVADIDRGGVFGSIIGTLAILPPRDRALIRSFAINRFRGDMALFRNGERLIAQRASLPSLGVFPMLEGANLHEEDSVSLEESRSNPEARIAVIRLPRISNFTDFRLLDTAWISHPAGRQFDWVILPGTKNTIGDLRWLRDSHLDTWILEQHRNGARILGICGGYQMLGRRVADPRALESGTPTEERGLGLLPVETELAPAKVVRTVQAQVNGIAAPGYEIHLGRTSSVEVALTPFALLPRGRTDGAVLGRVMGTYLHGILEHRALAAGLFGSDAVRASIDGTYDQLADWFEKHANLDLFEELYL